MTERIDQQFGNYRLLRLLGRGGFADVYLGEHTYLHKPAALKVLRLRLGEQETEQFLREAQTLARMEHPHIVRIFDFAVQDGLPYLVMDYAPGGSLRTKYPAGTCLALEQILTYVTQVATALQFAHDQHLIHRDVKPENMLLDGRSQVLLADFGLARLSPTRSANTQAMDPAMAGTAPYLAPEQVQGQPCVASDQYALAIVVYEWLSGQRPFKGTPIEIALQHVQASPPPLHEQWPDLSPEVEQVVLRALSKAPEQRFPSVQDFAIALQHAAHPAGEAYITSALLKASAATPGERTAPESFWKVPTCLTPLVGREQDVASVCIMLSRSEVRLLTLLGVGGIGKTRLSIQVATQLRDRFADGVCFVSLAPISDPTLVISSIAHELGLQEAGARPLVETVKAWLQDKHFLLLLDNFEQVVSAAPLLEDLLVACPRLVILVTSREVLHLSSEHLFLVPTLSLPDLAQLPDHEQLLQYAAVSLFVQRAQASKSDFTLTQANGRVIAELCVRLDGLPLAIELAAARIRLLPPQALLARLSQRFQILTGGSRTLPERQKTLRNTIQWSYDLLNEEEQRLFRLLSVFVGGCTLEAIEAVCHSIGDEKIDVVNVITSLIDKSLLHQTEQEGEEPRLMMLETIREYGLEALKVSSELNLIRHAHATYCLRLAEQAEPGLEGLQQAVWFDRLETEHDNLRAALLWSLEYEKEEMGLRLAGALRWFWMRRSYLSEGRMWLTSMLGRACGTEPTHLRAKALAGACGLVWLQGDYPAARALGEESVALCRALEDKRDLAFSLLWLSSTSGSQGDQKTAALFDEESVALFRQVEDRWGVAFALFGLGIATSSLHNYSLARSYYEEGLALSRALGDKWIEALILSGLGVAAFAQEDYSMARPLLEEGVSLLRAQRDKRHLALYLYYLGRVTRHERDYQQTAALYKESLALYEELGHKPGLARILCILGKMDCDKGDYEQAGAHLKESLALMQEIKNRRGIASVLEGFAMLTMEQQQVRLAAQLLGAAEVLREAIGAPVPLDERADYEQTLAAARTQLGVKSFAAAWDLGRSMTPEQALDAQETAQVALSVPTEPPSSHPAKDSLAYPAGLTAREMEVLRLVAQGMTNPQIAEQLILSLHTVNAHVRSIYTKLELNSRSALTRYAVEHHLL
jgi:predicted ATPase/DNA-binding CsgD family transcriptional regulator